MRKIILIALLFLIALSSDGFCRNFALIAGGTHEPKPDSTFSNNIFSNSMGSWSRTLKEKNWNVDVLFNGEHYFSDWTEFHVSTRPTDAASSSFTKDHLTERVNHLLEQNLTAEDQVELAISEHGSVREGQFGITAENGRMEADNLTSYLEKLLETGAKVHLNLDSCYSGQFIKNAQALLNHPLYGSKLCITTLAAQDAEGQLNDSLLDKMSQIINLGQTDTSVETLFLKARRHAPSTTEDFLRALYEKRFYQISSFPQWMEHPLHRTKAILSLPNQEQTPEVTGLLCSLEPTLLEEVQNRIRPIADIFSHFSPTQPEKLSAQERLQVICSKEYQDQLSIRYLDKKNQFENRYELPTATVLSKEASEAFLTRRKDKCTLDGISYAYPTKDKEGNALCQFDTEELLTFIIDRETENPKKTTLITRSLSHSLGKKKLTDMLTDYRPIHQEWMEGQCDGIKLYVLEHQIFEEEYQKLPSSDNKRACQEFRF